MDLPWLDHLSMLSLAVLAAVMLIATLRLFGTRHVPVTAEQQLAGDGDYDYAVDHVEAHQATLDRFSALATTPSGYDCVAELVPETSRVRDAVQIRVVVEGATVGEIGCKEVRTFLAAMNGKPARCDALIVAPRDAARSLSVRLDLAWPPRIS
ncbi:hypothetical protein [Ancylobacter defluvii]|uniref:Uncharacterized protein n=1 Tax=Ancylobacter defluvii TaxID=1282440 RepID=A0A9W6NAM8_9HYPH|nr:hypothetical protein [Ancylobacter defluvii]MBS7587954.1 hypothetical protein [Ancylobacter defluvii]GLK83636.1 hypothetical protein GCM10017653_17050 [Ancylobacter defluvii]